MSEKLILEPGPHLYPVPAVMVSCAAENVSSSNIIAIAWAGVLCSSPPTIGIGVTPARHSHRIIADSEEFVINLPTREQVDVLDYCGTVSGRDVDKFAESRLTEVAAQKLQWAPLIEECPVNLECRVVRRLDMGSHELFAGEVVAVHAEEDWVDDAGNLLPRADQLFAFLRGRYHALDEELGRRGLSSR